MPKRLSKKQKWLVGTLLFLFFFFVFPFTKHVGKIRTKGVIIGSVAIGSNNVYSLSSSTSIIQTLYGPFIIDYYYSDTKGNNNVSTLWIEKGKEVTISGELQPLQTFLYFLRRFPFFAVYFSPEPPPLLSRVMNVTQFQIHGTEQKTIEGFLELNNEGTLYVEAHKRDASGYWTKDKRYPLTGLDTERLKWLTEKMDGSPNMQFIGKIYYKPNSSAVFEYTSYKPAGGGGYDIFVNNLLLQYDQEHGK